MKHEDAIASSQDSPKTHQSGVAASAKDPQGSNKNGANEDKTAEQKIINVTGKRKPEIKSIPRLSSLHDRLSSFLPELASANANLRPDDNLEQVKDGQYIDMDLGLGVLEPKDSDVSSTDSSDSEEPPTKRTKPDELKLSATTAQDIIQEV